MAALVGTAAMLAVVTPAQAAEPGSAADVRAAAAAHSAAQAAGSEPGDVTTLGTAEIRRFKSDQHGTCIEPWAVQVNVDATLGTCNREVDRWLLHQRGNSPSGRPLIQLQSYLSNHCLDTVGRGAGGVVRLGGCSSGANQLWEFHTVGNDVVIKSWGAWTGAQRHLCLWAETRLGRLKLGTCASANRNQQWQY